MTEVIALKTHLNGDGTRAEAQLFYLHIGFGEIVGVLLGTLAYQFLRSFVAGGVDDELSIVLASELRSVCCMETRRSTALERGDTYHAFILPDHVLQRVGNLCSLLDTDTCWQINLYGKLVAVGNRHQLDGSLGEYEQSDDESRCSHTNGCPGMTEAPCDKHLVVLVHDVEKVERLLAVLRLSCLDRFLDEVVLQDRQQRLCNNH